MAISIPASSLTGAEQAKRKTALADLQRRYTEALRNRQRQAANAGRFARSTPRARATSQQMYDRAIALERSLKAQRGSAQAGLTQFNADWGRLATLDKDNKGNLDTILTKLLPFDPQSATERLQAQQGLNQRLIGAKTAKDALAGDYSTARRSLETEQPNRLRALLSNFAGRGLAHSTGYGSALGQETADYTERQSALDTANQRGLAQIGLEEGGAQSDFLSQIAGILYGSTNRLASRAGTLGMAGNRDLPLLLELAKRRLTSSGAA